MNHGSLIRLIDGPSNIVQEFKLWDSIHKLMVQQKIRMFPWKAVLNILPTGGNLRKRRLEDNRDRVHYGFQTKNDHHILFNCEFANKFWDLIPFR